LEIEVSTTAYVFAGVRIIARIRTMPDATSYPGLPLRTHYAHSRG
jgi:hypothetical protein